MRWGRLYVLQPSRPGTDLRCQLPLHAPRQHNFRVQLPGRRRDGRLRLCIPFRVRRIFCVHQYRCQRDVSAMVPGAIRYLSRSSNLCTLISTGIHWYNRMGHLRISVVPYADDSRKPAAATFCGIFRLSGRWSKDCATSVSHASWRMWARQFVLLWTGRSPGAAVRPFG